MASKNCLLETNWPLFTVIGVVIACAVIFTCIFGVIIENCCVKREDRHAKMNKGNFLIIKNIGN